MMRVSVLATALVQLALVQLALAMLSSAPVLAQEVRATISVPTGEFTVGDVVSLKLVVKHPPGAVFEEPDLSPLNAPAEGTGKEAGASLLVEKVARQAPDVGSGQVPDPGETTWIISARPFTTGEIPIPAIEIRYHLNGSEEKLTAATEATFLMVASVLKAPDEPPADIRGPWFLPRAWWPVIAGALAALAAAAAAWYLWKRWRRRPKAAPVPEVPAAPPAPAELPYDRALRLLADLLASPLLGQGRVKEFHVRLSEIVKEFLGSHLKFDAVDRTSQEVLGEMLRCGAGPGLREPTQWFLTSCDLVKFAKHLPSSFEIDATVARARVLIEAGRPAPAGREEEAA